MKWKEYKLIRKDFGNMCWIGNSISSRLLNKQKKFFNSKLMSTLYFPMSLMCTSFGSWLCIDKIFIITIGWIEIVLYMSNQYAQSHVFRHYIDKESSGSVWNSIGMLHVESQLIRGWCVSISKTNRMPGYQIVNRISNRNLRICICNYINMFTSTKYSVIFWSTLSQKIFYKTILKKMYILIY